MGLQFEVESVDDLDDSIKSLYVQHGDKYRLDVSGIDPADELKEALRKEREERKKAKEMLESIEAQRKEAEEAARIAAEEAAKKSGDTEALERSWQEKLTKRERELMEQIQARDNAITATTVDSVALALASELAVQGSAPVLLPHIKSRLSVEQREGKFVTVVRDAEGKPSADSIDDLKKEFISNPAFAPLIVGTKATGGGANGSNGGGAAKKADIGGSKAERLAYIEQRLKQAS